MSGDDFRLTVLLTRPEGSGSGFTRILEEAGHRVLHAPMIRLEDPEDWDPVDEAIDAIGVYSGILLTSAQAAVCFLDRCRERGLSAADLPPIHAVGPKTAAQVEEFGAEVRTIAERSDGAGLADALGEVSNSFFLQPGSDLMRTELSDLVARRGGKVHPVVVYRTIPPDPAQVEHIDRLLISGLIDCVAFFSPSAVRNFSALIPSFKQATVMTACIGQTTAMSLMNLGLRVDLISPEANEEALARAIVERLGNVQSRIEFDEGERSETI